MNRALGELASALLILGLVAVSLGECAGIKETGVGIERGDGSFEGCGGANIYYQYWRVENPKAIMILVHGFGEHSDRYDAVARHFCEQGITATLRITGVMGDPGVRDGTWKISIISLMTSTSLWNL